MTPGADSICESCRRLMLWAVTAKKGRRIPLDPEPVENGNITLSGVKPLIATTLVGFELELAQRQGDPLYIAHHATCPEGRKWRKSKP